MAASNSTLTSLWDDIDLGTSSPSRQVEIKEEALQYYKDTGLDSVAREAGIIDANGELYSTQQVPVSAVQQSRQNQIQMIAVPVNSPMQKNQVQLVNVGQPQVLQPQLVQTTPKGAQMDILNTPVQLEQVQSINWGGAKRRSDIFDLAYPDGKRKKQEKGGKGLRHFSMKVCEKVQKKGVTSYNEVADELVTEFSDPRNMTPADQYDQKNIRRRVYDALNVLMAMNIISKEKKEIRWIGLPTNSIQECQNLEIDKRRRIERIKHKTQQLQELILQQIAFKNLVKRNRELESKQGPPASNSAIQLPFIIVNTSKKTVIDCSISNDKYEYLFNFDNTFEIHDDIEVLKRMGLAFGLEKNKCSGDDLQKAVKMIPRSLEPYVYELANVSTPREAGPSSSGSIAASSSSRSISPLATPLNSGVEDAEVAMATAGLSRQSSLTSYSVRDSPEDDYSDETDSDRSSPVIDV